MPAKKQIFVEDHVGKTYNQLSIIREVDPYIEKNGSKRIAVICKCSCGIEKKFRLKDILRGMTKSCGCLNLKRITDRNKSRAKNINNTDIQSDHPIYVAWYDMKRRCSLEDHPWYADYGGRGICYSLEWDLFDNFYNDMHSTWKKGLTLDRINVNQGYCKENCRWETTTVQNHNRRKIGKSSKYIGVCFSGEKNKWQVGICKDGVKKYVGRFSDELEAATAYDNASEELYGDRPNKTSR